MYAPILPSPTIPSSISASKLLSGDGHAVGRQLLPQLGRVLEMNRTHAQLLRTLKIEFPVVNEQALFRLALGHFERHPVDSFIWLPDAQVARAEKSLKLPPQVKLLDPSFVQFEPLVVDGGKQIFPSRSHIRENRARFRKLLRLSKNERCEFVPCEVPLAVEHGALQRIPPPPSQNSAVTSDIAPPT